MGIGKYKEWKPALCPRLTASYHLHPCATILVLLSHWHSLIRDSHSVTLTHPLTLTLTLILTLIPTLILTLTLTLALTPTPTPTLEHS